MLCPKCLERGIPTARLDDVGPSLTEKGPTISNQPVSSTTNPPSLSSPPLATFPSHQGTLRIQSGPAFANTRVQIYILFPELYSFILGRIVPITHLLGGPISFALPSLVSLFLEALLLEWPPQLVAKAFLKISSRHDDAILEIMKKLPSLSEIGATPNHHHVPISSIAS